jgi:hypothetical protein
LILERAALKGGSLVVILILLSVSAFCVYVIARMLESSERDVFAVVLFAAFPAFAIPLSAWEVKYLLPARLEMTERSARFYLGGRLSQEIVLGPSVKADVKLDSSRIGPKPKAFDSCCDDTQIEVDRGEFLLLCGISLTDGDASISISHEEGWQLVDFAEVWDSFLDLVVRNDMDMGSEMWRYVEFRDSFQQMGEDVEPDIFERIRELEI